MSGNCLTHAATAAAPIERVRVGAYRLPTDAPEADGTIEWSATTVVVVKIVADNQCGLGFSYADVSAAEIIQNVLADTIVGTDALSIPRAHAAMARALRNLGRPGIGATALSAVDVALWDLKARLLSLSLADLLGRVREEVALYGSGGFTSYDDRQLCAQMAEWAEQGFTRVKMKIGRDTSADRRRVKAVREAIGPNVDLFVDANGAYQRKEALQQAVCFADSNVTWFEEPVSSDDLEGLRLLRDRAPAGMAIAAGEYGYTPWYFRRMLEAGAVDVLQADATRCGGVTGFLVAASLCEAAAIPLSAHTAPAIHAQLGCAAPRLVHVEYFHDHARIERMLFDGVLEPQAGNLRPDRERPGLGLELKESEAKRWLVYETR